jgi:hypothetical protein
VEILRMSGDIDYGTCQIWRFDLVYKKLVRVADLDVSSVL